MKREPGYYWVMPLHKWTVGVYSANANSWKICGCEETFEEDELVLINETRLTSPAESQGENKQ